MSEKPTSTSERRDPTSPATNPTNPTSASERRDPTSPATNPTNPTSASERRDPTGPSSNDAGTSITETGRVVRESPDSITETGRLLRQPPGSITETGRIVRDAPASITETGRTARPNFDRADRTPAPRRSKQIAAVTTDPVLAVTDVSIKRGGRLVIDALSLAALPGEIVGVVGRNGCGKSTLLMSIAGLLAPRDGRIVVEGANVWGTRKEQVRARRSLGYVPEGADPPGFLLGGELWALIAATRKCGPPSPALREALGLDELREVAIERMSLGQRRRACLGAAFMGPPKLLVLDEPDNGLDVKRLDALVALVKAHAEQGGSCLLASHDASLLDHLGARMVTLKAIE